MMPGAKEYLRKCELLDYTVFRERNKPFNFNIVGWRNTKGRVNHFDDALSIYWEDKGRWIEFTWPITTKPGLWYLLKPLNVKGTAILVPGQYKRAYAIGSFRNYSALKQVEPVKIYRDNILDDNIDLDSATIELGLFGIHIHRAGIYNRLVGGSSAGCQVFQRAAHFREFMDLCFLSEKYWGSVFSYTLVEF